jgi:predicted ferric reductase
VKKRVLLGAMAVCVLLPLVFWARTLSAGMSLGAALNRGGRFLALTGFVFILAQFVLSSKIRWIERDIGLDKLIIAHRRCGVAGLVLILVHPVPLFAGDLVDGFGPTISQPKVVGFISLMLFSAGVGAAILTRRLKLRYETWKAIHWATYLALPLGFLHSLTLGSDLAGPLRAFWFALAAVYAAVVAHKLWRVIRVRRSPYRVVDVVQETHDVCTLTMEGPRMAYKPGQFLIVQLVRDGRTSSPHPFTMSSSPTRDGLSISVKASGDFTATIPDTRPGDRAYVDAPYGAFSFLNHDAPNLVFVAGGIGITPFISTLRYMADKKLARSVVLIWGNKTERDIAFRDEIDRLAGEMETLRVVHVMSSQADWPGEKGYVTAGLLERTLGGIADPEVFVCGPPVMMTAVVAALRAVGVPRGQIHYERFALR